MRRTLVLLMMFSVGFVACQKDKTIIRNENEAKEETLSVNADQKTAFGRILSKAVSKNEALRAFLKSEAIKQLDNDYDVIYGFCKDHFVQGKETFQDVLTDFEEYPGQLEEIVINNPTLTILVPQLPGDVFSADTWDTKNTIPFVTANVGKAIPVYYDGIEVYRIKENEVPAIATLLVKDNERIRSKTPSLKASSGLNKTSYEFISEAFDGFSKTKSRATVQNDPNLRTFLNTFDFEVSPKIMQGATEFPITNGGWQRDYVYYNLKNIPNPKGVLDRSYYECISAIKITNSGLSLMMDQDDPTYSNTDNYNTRDEKRSYRGPGKFWRDGKFEIQIDVLINDISGAGSVFSTVVSAKGDELFGSEYSETVNVPPRNSPAGTPTYVYRTLSKMVPRYFYCHIPIKEWELDKMGSSWKISLRENDDNTVITQSETTTTKFASNFGVDVGWGEKVKIGLKFGVSAEVTNTSTTSVQRTLSNDFLGDAIVNFSDPILRNTTKIPGDDYGFVVDLKSLDRRLSAVNYINMVDYDPSFRKVYGYEDEQDAIKSSAQNRLNLSSFNPIVSTNFEIIMTPVYKY